MCGLMAAATLMASGSVISAIGQNEQGKYQQQVANNNAIIQERLAKDAIKRGGIDEAQHRDKVAQFKAKQRASMAASGISIDSGSAEDILNDTTMMGELDALTIRNNAEREAFGHRAGAANQIAQGQLSRTSGKYGAMGTILSGSGQAAATWYSQ